MENNCIAVIYEGNKTERILIENLKKIFFLNRANIVFVGFPAGQNIYMLWKQIQKDEYETDLIELIREYNRDAAEKLKGYSRDDFSEIYLFFDYDGHNCNLSATDPDGTAVLGEMLETFDNETELGKLYINYPMVEAIRDNKKEDCCYRRCSVSLEEAGKYKNIVSDMKEFQDFRKYTYEDWQYLCQQAIRKANCIVQGKYETASYKELFQYLSQQDIYQSQQKNFVSKGEIAILSSVPLFLLEYFPGTFYEKILEQALC